MNAQFHRKILLALLATSALAPSQITLAQKTSAQPCNDVTALETAAKTQPGNLSNLIDLGQAYLCVGRLRDAQLTLEDATSLDYKSFEAHFYLGQALAEQSKFDAAKFEYQQLESLYPDRLEPKYQLGVIATRLGKDEEAIKYFGDAIEAGKKSKAPLQYVLDSHAALANQQRAKRDFEGAAKTFASALEFKPGDPELALGQAQALYDGGKATEALPLVYAILNKQPNYLPAINLAAQIYETQGQPERALRELNRAIDLSKSPKDRASLLVRRGLTLAKLGRNSEAASSLAEASNANPSSWEAQYNLGTLLIKTNPQGALAAFKRAATIRPEDGETQIAIASTQQRMGNHQSAYQTARRAVPLLVNANQKTQAQLIMGKSAYALAQYTVAATSLRQAVANDPTQFEPQMWLGLTLLKLKDAAGAAAALENAVKINPASIEARINLGAVYISQNRPDAAVELLRGAVQAQPNNIEALTNLGLGLAKLERYPEACVHLKRATALGSSKARNLLRAISPRCMK